MTSEAESPSGLIIQTSFVRGRNCLYAAVDMGQLYVDYYLHLKDNCIEVDAIHDAMFKEALAGFALHCVSRPRNEVLAWTINFQDPLLNLFFAGDTSDGSVVGRLYAENIKKAEENVFYQELIKGNRPLHRSVVGFQGSSPLASIEAFYRQSEQRPAKLFCLEGDTYAMISAHPDYDREWFENLKGEDLLEIENSETLSPLEKRPVSWKCGCDQMRILKTLEPIWNQDPDGLFLGEEIIEVNCPRCAGKFRITRETMAAYAEESGKA